MLAHKFYMCTDTDEELFLDHTVLLKSHLKFYIYSQNDNVAKLVITAD